MYRDFRIWVAFCGGRFLLLPAILFSLVHLQLFLILPGLHAGTLIVIYSSGSCREKVPLGPLPAKSHWTPRQDPLTSVWGVTPSDLYLCVYTHTYRRLNFKQTKGIILYILVRLAF